MRKINGIISGVVLAMFVLHGVLGALNMMNIAPIIVKALSRTMLALIGVHALIMLLVFFHMTAFGYTSGGVFRLVPFDVFRLITQLLLLFSVAVHVITNVKPMLITFGVRKLRPKAGDILFFVSAAMLFMAVGFIIYYIRWQL